MDVFFETQNGYNFSIEVGYWDTVLEIKKKIEKYQRFPVSKQTLFFQGKVLIEEDLCVQQSKIFHNSRLQLFVSPPYLTTNHMNHQSLVSSKSIGDIIYGEDLPLTTKHFINIQAFCPVTTEAIIQVLQTEKSPPSNSIKEIINIPDSPVKLVKMRSNNNNNDQVLRTEQFPESNSLKAITTNVQDPAVKRRVSVFVLPYSGDNKAARKTPVGVNMSDNVKELRKELVKIQKRGQLELPKEGYFFIHQQSVMEEDRSFSCNGVIPGDVIEIITRESYLQLFRTAL